MPEIWHPHVVLDAKDGSIALLISRSWQRQCWIVG
jgi:hypothetical protein